MMVNNNFENKIYVTEENTWDDVNFYFKNRPIEMIVFGRPPSIEKDIFKIIKSIKSHAQLQISDEDGEISDWGKV